MRPCEAGRERKLMIHDGTYDIIHDGTHDSIRDSIRGTASTQGVDRHGMLARAHNT